MRYIAKVTAHHAQHEVERVKNLLLESNPILESFGNARTNRNDNSSRFVSLMNCVFCMHVYMYVWSHWLVQCWSTCSPYTCTVYTTHTYARMHTCTLTHTHANTHTHTCMYMETLATAYIVLLSSRSYLSVQSLVSGCAALWIQFSMTSDMGNVCFVKYELQMASLYLVT